MSAVLPEIEYWQKRGDRAIASQLVHSVRMLDATRDHLYLLRESLRIGAALRPYLPHADAFKHRLGVAVARYYRAEGLLTRRIQIVGDTIDRAEQRAIAR